MKLEIDESLGAGDHRNNVLFGKDGEMGNGWRVWRIQHPDEPGMTVLVVWYPDPLANGGHIGWKGWSYAFVKGGSSISSGHADVHHFKDQLSFLRAVGKEYPWLAGKWAPVEPVEDPFVKEMRKWAEEVEHG